MTTMRSLAKFDGYEVIQAIDGCIYLHDSDGYRTMDSPYSALLIVPAHVKLEIAKQLNERLPHAKQ